jgi:hypothetical protein
MAIRTFRIRADPSAFKALSLRYETEHEGVPALAPYPTLDALVTTLSGRDRADLPRRSHLLAAIAAHSRAAPSPLWSAVLLDAFRGMLVLLARELQGVERSETPALVGACFCEALARVRPERDPGRFPMYVRQETRRRVFRLLAHPERVVGVLPPEEEGWWEEPEVEVERLADPRSTRPIEDWLVVWKPRPVNVTDDDLLRAHAVRGGLRRLARLMLPRANKGRRESVYRRLLQRVERLIRRRRRTNAGLLKASEA